MEKQQIDNITSRYIDTLYANQNNTDTPHLKDMYSKEEYNMLISDIVFLLKEYPNQDILFYREELFKRSKISEVINSFLYKLKLTPGFVITFGSKLNKETIVCGNKQEVLFENGSLIDSPTTMTKDTIFDLASTSKLLTAISVLKLCECGLINLDDPITNYVHQFSKLNDVTIFDLLTFKVPIKSTERIDKAKTLKEAYQRVCTLEKESDHEPTFPYTDMGSIALRYVIENVTHMPLVEFINEEILKKCNMKSTYLNVPEELRCLVANENYSSIVDANGKIITDYSTPPGVVHDAKTKALGHALGIAPGHAGFFSTAEDLDKLARNIMDYKLLNKEHTLMLGQNFVGTTVKNTQGNEVYNCHHGILTYSKQKCPNHLSLVRPFLSGKAFASPGFTGTCLCVDPLNEISTAIGTNRLHNRIYKTNPQYINQIVKHPDGETQYTDPFTNETKIISKEYAHKSVSITQITMRLALQYRLLEQVLNQKEELNLTKQL